MEKIKLFDPRALRYLPQKPLLSTVNCVAVSTVITPKHFYVQLKGTQLEELAKKMAVYKAPSLKNPKVGDLCVAEIDGTKYRCQVVLRRTEDVINVKSVDCGFEEDVHNTDIKIMVEEWLDLPPFAVRCCLEGFEDMDEKQDKLANKFYELCKQTSEFTMQIKSKENDFYVVSLEDGFTGEKVVDSLKGLQSSFNSVMEEKDESQNPKRVNDLSVNSDWTEKPSTMSVHFNHHDHGNDLTTWVISSPSAPKQMDNNPEIASPVVDNTSKVRKSTAANGHEEVTSE